MADRVQYRLERMLKELDDLEERKLFTRSELEEIVEKRRRFEYRLERPSPLKKDFIAYIEFETQLDSLRRLRKLRNNDRKKSASDFACVRRIIGLYDRVVARFKGDIELWFRYLEFCRARKNGRIKEVLAKVIRFHPKVPGVWIYAAAWEFDHNLNVTAARSIMQHGLRECRASEDLWIEYLRMELTYLNKLKARKVALGEDKGTLVRHHIDAEEKQWREDNKELFMSIDEEPVNNDGSESSDGENKELGTNADLFKEQGSNILKTIYRGAVEALSSSFGLRKRFFEILEVIDLAHSEDLKKEILAELKRDFSTDPEYWDWLARLEMSNSGSTHKKGDDNELSHVQKAIQVYEEALQIVPSAMMFKLYTKFLKDFIAPVKGGDEVSRSSEHLAKYISHLLMVYEKAESVDCLTEDLACEYISFYLQQGRVDEARGLAGKLCSGKLSNSVKLWLLRVSIEIRSVTRNAPSPTKADLLTVFELLESVLKKVPLSKAESLWIMALQLFAADKHYFDKLVEMSFLLVAKDGGSDIGFCVSSAIVNFVLQKDGIQNAREIYKRFLSVPRPGLVLYKDCIELEMNLASVGDKDCLANARKLFESALTTYQQNVSLWRDYYSMETKLGTSDTATAIYWRARKILKDPNAAAAVITQDRP